MPPKFVSIPQLKLTKEQEIEICAAINNNVQNLKSYYDTYTQKIKAIRAAKNCENYETPLKTMRGEDDDESPPNVHIPDLKNNGNVGTAELADAIFGQDFMSWQAIDPEDEQYEDMFKAGIDAIRDLTYAYITEFQIVENLYYEGTCPVVIGNAGRINAINDVIYEYEIKIPSELKIPLNYTVLKTAGIEEPTQAAIEQLDLGNSLKYSEDYKKLKGETDEHEVGTVSVVSNNGDALFHFVDKDDMTAIQQCEDLLTSIGFDLSMAEMTPKKVKTTEEWIEGYPKLNILNILNTYIEPAVSNDNPETVQITYVENKKTQEIVDNPNFINTDKLIEGDKLKGKEAITQTNHTKAGNTDTDKSLITNDAFVEFKQVYFDSFRFKDGEVLRNFIVSIADKDILLECRPNISYTEINNKKITQNPFIIFCYTRSFGDNVGSSPGQDSIELSRIRNLLYNYGLDTLARSGNKYIMDSNIDLKTFGTAGTIFEIDMADPKFQALGINNVSQLVMQLPSSQNEAVAAFEASEMLRPVMQQLSNTSQSYFQDNPQVTATLTKTLANQAMGIMKVAITNIARTFCKAYSRIADDCIQRGLKVDNVAIVNSKNGERKFDTIDFKMFKGKKFIPVINSLNPALTKAVLAQTLREILQEAMQSGSPEIMAVINVPEIVTEMINSMGINNPNLLRSVDEQKEYMATQDLKTKLLNQFLQQQEQAAHQQKMAAQVQDQLQKKQMSKGLEAERELQQFMPPQQQGQQPQIR